MQRVSSASVNIEGETKTSIGTGLLILLGISATDSPEDVTWLAKKIAALRIFSDEVGLMNKNINEVGGEAVVVSQFTLHASYKKGNRPSFITAARPELAIPLYESFVKQLGELIHKPIQTGTFGADMKVALVNDGPVTIIMDTQNKE